MTTTIRAAATAAVTMASAFLFAACLLSSPASAAWNAPWKDQSRALVVDAYEFNPINWKELTADKRIAGFINKASDGLPPEWNCSGETGDDYKLCKNRWWKYSVTKELYMTRREMAKMKGLKWGAYHLGRPGNPRAQADHFVDFAEPEADDLIALDIEDIGDEWMSLSDAEIFADQVKVRTGRYPMLYTNGSTAKYIADHAEDYPLLSRLKLWYARYRENIADKFPSDTWPTYALWQFSSMHNCDSRSCPYRVKGTKTDIDVNVSTMDVADMKAAWPFDGLVERPKQEADPKASTLIASIDDKTLEKVASVAIPTPRPDRGDGTDDGQVQVAALDGGGQSTVPGTMAAAYGPSGLDRHPIDPLKLLNDVAAQEKAADRKSSNGPRRNLARTQTSVAVDPKMTGTVLAAAATRSSKTLSSSSASTAKPQDAPLVALGEPAEGGSQSAADRKPTARTSTITIDVTPQIAARLAEHVETVQDAVSVAALKVKGFLVGSQAQAQTKGTGDESQSRRSARTRLSELTAHQRSRFLAIMEEAGIRRNDPASASASASSKADASRPGDDGFTRGPRITLGSLAKGQDLPARRILAAFATTR